MAAFTVPRAAAIPVEDTARRVLATVRPAADTLAEAAATVEVAVEVATMVAAEAVAITVAVADRTAAVRTEAEVTPEDTAASES